MNKLCTRHIVLTLALAIVLRLSGHVSNDVFVVVRSDEGIYLTEWAGHCDR